MGFRTVVMLCNDQSSTWENDANLGKKIARAMNAAMGDKQRPESMVDNYGQVVQCTHGDTQTLAILDGYTMFRPLTHKGWTRGEEDHTIAVRLLKDAAEKMGYRLSRKPVRQ